MRKKNAILAAILICALVVGIVVAQIYVNRPVGFTGTIVVSYTLQTYSNVECTTVLTTFDLGSTIHHGDVISKSFWLKNTGEAVLLVYYNFTSLPTGITTVVSAAGETWVTRTSLAANTVLPINVQFTIGSTAAIGPVAFTMNLDGTDT